MGTWTVTAPATGTVTRSGAATLAAKVTGRATTCAARAAATATTWVGAAVYGPGMMGGYGYGMMGGYGGYGPGYGHMMSW